MQVIEYTHGASRFLQRDSPFKRRGATRGRGLRLEAICVYKSGRKRFTPRLNGLRFL